MYEHLQALDDGVLDLALGVFARAGNATENDRDVARHVARDRVGEADTTRNPA